MSQYWKKVMARKTLTGGITTLSHARGWHRFRYAEGTRGKPAKNPQVNSPVCAGPRRLKTRKGEGVCLSFKKPANLRVFMKKLPIKVIYTRTGSATTSAGTRGSHPSRMGVTVPRNMSPVGIIRGAPVLCPIPCIPKTLNNSHNTQCHQFLKTSFDYWNIFTEDCFKSVIIV